jgi:UDP-N-acetylmuramate: L-alanyl-gamma-D-glutamyl-meso-diaminopimelate ligase
MQSLSQADVVYIHDPDSIIKIDIPKNLDCTIFNSVDSLLKKLQATVKSSDNVLIMSNGGFENIHQRLIDLLNKN